MSPAPTEPAVSTLVGVIITQAIFLTDGSCRLIDRSEGGRELKVTWPSVYDWASDWLLEWRTEEYGEASDFIVAACDDAVSGVVGALVVLAEAADGDADMLACVGAGPLEDLLSHTGNGPLVMNEVARAALQSPALHQAMGATIMPQQIEAGLAALGVLVRPPGSF